MLFNSLPFLFLFLPIVLIVSRQLRGVSLLTWITLSSFFFYSFAGHVWFIIPMLITTLTDFYVGQLIESSTTKKQARLLLTISICFNLSFLFYFKYSTFVLQIGSTLFANYLHLKNAEPVINRLAQLAPTILPAGISFYTFQTLSYIIDVYRGEAKAEKNIWKFAGFVSFFPHLVAGPLTRHNQLIPGLTKTAKHGISTQWRAGLFLFSIGLIKKVLLADRIAVLIDPIIDNSGDYHFILLWVATLGYALQIYFDFSGYSDMALGLARLFGIELPINFNSPYQAQNPSDFWRRWHITLSNWLRDYLYISLGGNRGTTTSRYRNLMITMILGGLWHGANFTFVIWGAYHGFLLVLFQLTKKQWDRLAQPVQRTFTFVLVTLGWIPFRASTFEHFRNWTLNVFLMGHKNAFSVSSSNLALITIVLLGLGIVLFCRNAASDSQIEKLRPSYQVVLGILTGTSIVLMNYSSRFLYFQF